MTMKRTTGQNHYGLAARRFYEEEPPPRTLAYSSSTPDDDDDDDDSDLGSTNITMSDILHVLRDDTSSTVSSVSFISLTSDAILLAEAGAIGVLQVQGPQPDEEPTERPHRPKRMPVVKEQDFNSESSTEEEAEEQLDSIELGAAPNKQSLPSFNKTLDGDQTISKRRGISMRRWSFIALTVLCLIGVTAISINAVANDDDEDKHPSKTTNNGDSSTAFNTSLPPTVSPTTMPPTSPPTSYETRWMYLLASAAPNTILGWNDSTSKQTLALQWLVNTTNETETEERVLQRYAMAMLYYNTNGDTWSNNSGWLDQNEHECQWLATTCDENGLVIGLNLTQNHLNGSIPEELALMAPSLVTLDMSINNLTSTLPTTLGKLSLLETLNLRENHLTGPLPSQLGQLTQLQVLNVMHNGLSGPIPSSLDNLNAAIRVYVAQTGLLGSAAAFCNNEGLSDLWADCDQVSCPCCTVCCYDQLGSCFGV